MMNKKKTIFLFVIIPFLGLLLYYFAWSFGPGSYDKSEVYELKVSEENLIKAINEVKRSDSTLTLPKFIDLTEGRLKPSDHWYNIYFFYPESNKIIHTWTRPKSDNRTYFGFAAVNEGTKLGNWKEANENFLPWKNSKLKDEFEIRILKKIEEELRKKKPNNN